MRLSGGLSHQFMKQRRTRLQEQARIVLLSVVPDSDIQVSKPRAGSRDEFSNIEQARFSVSVFVKWLAVETHSEGHS